VRRLAALLLCLVAVTGAAVAKPPAKSLRPVARAEPDGSISVAPPAVQAEPTGGDAPAPAASTPPSYRAAAIRPPERPVIQPPATPGAVARPQDVGVAPDAAPQKKFRLFGALRPKPRSPQIEEQGRAKSAARARGAVCGDVEIQGVSIGRVPGPVSGCGVEDAVRVSSVSGVGLSTHAVMDCTTAKALKRWVDKGAKPALKKRGGGVSQIRVVAHYACRTRNNQKGERISEHGKGRAIDIAGFTMKDGSRISVLDGWNAKADAKPLRQMHAAACGPFGTVLGPNANSFHRDHFHFDTARYRSGSYCR
jgi:hypothetical protein